MTALFKTALELRALWTSVLLKKMGHLKLFDLCDFSVLTLLITFGIE